MEKMTKIMKGGEKKLSMEHRFGPRCDIRLEMYFKVYDVLQERFGARSLQEALDMEGYDGFRVRRELPFIFENAKRQLKGEPLLNFMEWRDLDIQKRGVEKVSKRLAAVALRYPV